MPRARAAKPFDDSTFEGRLRDARTRSEVSAEKFAEAMGLASKQSVYDYENPAKSSSPSPQQLAAFAKLAGVSVDWLLFGDASNAPSELDVVRQLTALLELLDDRGRDTVLAVARQQLEISAIVSEPAAATVRRAERDRLAAPFAENEDGELVQHVDEEPPARRRARR